MSEKNKKNGEILTRQDVVDVVREVMPEFVDSVVSAINKSLGARLDKMDDRFDKMDDRFDKMDDRFDKLDDRFDKNDSVLHKLNMKVDLLDSNIRVVDKNVRKLQEVVSENTNKITALEKTVEILSDDVKDGFEKVNGRLDVLENTILEPLLDTGFNTLNSEKVMILDITDRVANLLVSLKGKDSNVLEKMEVKINELTKQIDELKRMIEDCKDYTVEEILKLKNEISLLNDRVTSLENILQ